MSTTQSFAASPQPSPGDYIHGLSSRYSTGDGRLNFLDKEDSDFRQPASLVPIHGCIE